MYMYIYTKSNIEKYIQNYRHIYFNNLLTYYLCQEKSRKLQL